MSRPNFNRILGTTITRHALRPPKRTALVWCKRCSRRHAGQCDLVQVPARTREGRELSIPHFGHTRRARRRKIGWED